MQLHVVAYDSAYPMNKGERTFTLNVTWNPGQISINGDQSVSITVWEKEVLGTVRPVTRYLNVHRMCGRQSRKLDFRLEIITNLGINGIITWFVNLWTRVGQSRTCRLPRIRVLGDP